MNISLTEEVLKNHEINYFIVNTPKSTPKHLDTSKYNIFNKLGIAQPWTHQEKTIDLIKNKNNVLLISGTGSGKTEAAVGSILENLEIEKGKNCQILFVYPTKALTNDQFERLKTYFSEYKTCAFDADNDRRRREVSRSEVVITNPQMLFMHLKYNTQFSYFLKNIKFIVVDEFHLYDPYQLSLIYSMLKHILTETKNEISIIFLSATIGNYEILCSELNKLSGNWEYMLGETYQEKMRNIVLKIKKDGGIFELLRSLVKSYLSEEVNSSTIIFVPYVSMANSLSSKFKREFRAYRKFITCHHGKLGAEERKEIENKMRIGEIRICFTTKTLQQGIDIGYLNRVIHVGLPETFSEFKQRQGRVGRREGVFGESIIIPFFPSDYEYLSDRSVFLDYLSKKTESIIYDEDSFAFKLAYAYFKSPKLPEESVVESLKGMGIAKRKIDVNNYLITGEIDKELQITDYGEEIFNILSFYGQGTLNILLFKNGKVYDESQISFQEALRNALPGCIIYHDGKPWYVNAWSTFPQNIFKSDDDIKIYCVGISESPYARYSQEINEGTIGTHVNFDSNRTRFVCHFSNFGELYLIPSSIPLLNYSEDKITSIKTTPISFYPQLPLLTNCIHLKFDRGMAEAICESALHAFQRSIRNVHNLSPTLFQHIIYEKDGCLEGFFYEVTLGNVLSHLDIESISKEAIKMRKNEYTLWLPRCNFKIGENLNYDEDKINECINLIKRQMREQIIKRW